MSLHSSVQVPEKQVSRDVRNIICVWAWFSLMDAGSCEVFCVFCEQKNVVDFCENCEYEAVFM
jgi:hypothetical protein